MAPVFSLNEFEHELINTTFIRALLRYLPYQFDFHRARVSYTLNHLVDLSKLKTPSFIFAHLIIPHPPFVFGQHGEPLNPKGGFYFSDGSHFMKIMRATKDEYVESYRKQVMFINSKIETTLDCMLSKSTRPTIIILQSDHGPGSMLDWENPDNTYFKERLSILNAYYFPDNDYIHLYNGISPVNTFRIILNHYFGANYELLEDKSYFSTWSQPYNFIDVTEKVNSEHSQLLSLY
jgi:hypothetical protein